VKRSERLARFTKGRATCRAVGDLRAGFDLQASPGEGLRWFAGQSNVVGRIASWRADAGAAAKHKTWKLIDGLQKRGYAPRSWHYAAYKTKEVGCECERPTSGRPAIRRKGRRPIACAGRGIFVDDQKLNGHVAPFVCARVGIGHAILRRVDVSKRRRCRSVVCN